MITLEEQIAEARRELALRKACYPAWVKNGKLDAGDAKYQLLCQQEIVRTLERIDTEQRQMSLFGSGQGEGRGRARVAHGAVDAPARARQTVRTPPHEAKVVSSALMLAPGQGSHIGGPAHFG